MANPEHLKILERGVDKWNEWRENHKDIKPDLSRADLREFDLNKTDLLAAITEVEGLPGINYEGKCCFCPTLKS